MGACTTNSALGKSALGKSWLVECNGQHGSKEELPQLGGFGLNDGHH